MSASINYLLGLVGIQGPGWLGSQRVGDPGVCDHRALGRIGGNRMMIFLAGLQGVPQELYDAAEIDGADAWQRFRHVTLPMISPTIFFNLVLGVIGALQVFTSPSSRPRAGRPTRPGSTPCTSTTRPSSTSTMGYASALAWIFFIVMLVFTVVQFRLSRRWVYYAGGGK